jgi:hypothetical protein
LVYQLEVEEEAVAERVTMASALAAFGVIVIHAVRRYPALVVAAVVHPGR